MMANRSFLFAFRFVIGYFLAGIFTASNTGGFSVVTSRPNLLNTHPASKQLGIAKRESQHDYFLHVEVKNPVVSTTALVLSTIPYQQRDDSGPLQLTVVSKRFNEIFRGVVPAWKSISEVTKWRIAAVSFVSTVVMKRSLIDHHILQPLWNHLISSPTSVVARIFRTDSYEWCLAIAAFTVIIHWYQYIDHQIQVANMKGVVHPYRKYRLQDRYLADKLRRRQQRQMLMSDRNEGINTNEPSIATNGNNEVDPSNVVVQQSKWHVGAYFFELWVYALPLLTWDILSPRRHRRLAAFGAPTTLQIMTDVTGSLLFYDFLFFVGHYMMHHIPRLYRWFHAKHHITDEVRACDIVRLSLVEEVYDVGCSIVALNLLSAHPISRSIYNVIIVFLLTELHSGFDFPWTPQNVIPFNIASGSRRHHYHHRYGQHYYQKFFFTFDRIFGFFQKDDGTIKGDCIKADAFVPASWKAV
jgi:sterol desaturase/sphingolipid hydroxylase (fatty acid hydroxylase superfamily)